MSVRFQLYVFDLDGTLIDSRRDLANSVNALLVECGAEPLPEARVGRMVGDGAATLVARAFEARAVARPRDALERFLALYDERLLEHTRPYDGIPAALDALRARAPLALLTNKPLASTRRILEGLALSAFFAPDAVLGGDGPLARKPDPSGLRHLIARAGVPSSETVLVGDSLVDWKTARAAAAHVCLVRYGFGFEGVPTADLGPEDRVIDHPEELTAL